MLIKHNPDLGQKSARQTNSKRSSELRPPQSFRVALNFRGQGQGQVCATPPGSTEPGTELAACL